MPYFKWVGVDSVGCIKKGRQVAHSSQNLSEQLFKQGVALLRCKTIHAPSFLWPITAHAKGNLFQQKATLLQAGLLLPQVLIVVAQQSYNPIMYDILFNVGNDIERGVPFAQALEKYSSLCDRIVMVMLIAGYESGNLVPAMENVALYFHKQHLFNKNIRTVLALPLLTLLFFIGITLFIFIFIVPRFVDMFSSLQQQLPPLTRFMIEVSEFIRSASMIYFLAASAAVVMGIYYYCMRRGTKVRDKIVAHLPFLGVIVWQHQMSQALRALSLLVNSGVTLVDALAIVSKSVEHFLVKSQLSLLHDDVASGQLLSNAMAMTLDFLPEVVALIHIGEETGTLGRSLDSASLVYSDHLEGQLKKFVFFLQPILIILLGLLVSTLIFAVYLPIMQLSYVI